MSPEDKHARLILIVGITIFARPLMELFLPADSPAIPIGIHMNSIVAWIYLMMGVSMVVTSVVRANGAVVVPFILLIISAVIVRFSFAFGLYPTWRAEAIWWSSVASGTVSMVLSLAYYFHGGWRKKRLETGIAPAVLPTPEPA